MHIDLTPLIQVLLPLALAAVTGAIPPLLLWASRYVALLRTTSARAAVDMAVKRGAGLAYNALLAASSEAHITIHNPPLAAGVQYVTSSVGAELTHLGITPDHVTTMVSGELGHLLAQDAGVTVGQAAAQQVAPSLPTATPESHS